MDRQKVTCPSKQILWLIGLITYAQSMGALILAGKKLNDPACNRATNWHMCSPMTLKHVTALFPFAPLGPLKVSGPT
jgi:hypothetical protein